MSRELDIIIHSYMKKLETLGLYIVTEIVILKASEMNVDYYYGIAYH